MNVLPDQSNSDDLLADVDLWRGRFEDAAARETGLHAENERLREILRTVAVAIPAEWGTARGHRERAYEAMSAFLTDDQRRVAFDEGDR